jgi:iron complex outermembrane recepter protein
MKNASALLLVGASAIALATPAHAQSTPTIPATVKPSDTDTNAGIADIVVTAQKRSENLQGVPIAITALTAAALETKGINSIQDFVYSPPPGLAVQAFAGSSNILIVDIRGVANPDPGQGTVELGVAIYQDDVYVGRAQGLGTDLADPERIEVLRGPQGTLFGRNAEGGAVRIVSSKPTGEFGGRVKVGYGNFGQQRYEAHINLPKVAGFALKLDYLKSLQDGFTRNGTTRVAGLARQDDFGGYNNEGYRASVRWQGVEGLTVDYAYDHSRALTTEDWSVLVAPTAPQPGYVAISAFLDGSRPVESISRRTDLVAPHFNEPFIAKTDGHTLTMAYELSDKITVKSISAWRSVNSSGSGQLGSAYAVVPFELIPGLGTIPASFLAPDPRFGSLGTVTPGTPITAVTDIVAYAAVKQSQFSQEVQLIGSTDTLQWVLGAYYFKEKVLDQRQVFFSGVFTDSFFPDFSYTNYRATNPFSLPFPGSGLTSQTAQSRSYAAFAQATWSPEFSGGRLHLTGGLRYTNDQKTALRTLNGGTAVNIPGSFKASRVDPAATIAYDVTQDVNAYFRFARAYRAGGSSIRDPQFRSFGAEVNTAYEIGVKSRFLDRHAVLNLSAFVNKIDGTQLTVITNIANSDSTIINAPGTETVKGVEAELTLSPAPGLTFNANYTYLETELPTAALAAIDKTGNFFIQNTPRHSISVSGDYVTPDLGFGKLAFHADYTVSSKFDGTVRVEKQDFAYPLERNVGNARISWQDIPIGPTKLMVSAYVKNAFNTIYPSYVAPFPNAFLSNPRTYGLEATVRF